MQPQSAGQGQPLCITPLPDQILHLITMADMDGRLFDDRAIIELFGDVVGCSTDQFDAPFPCPVIGLSSFESRQKGMVMLMTSETVSENHH